MAYKKLKYWFDKELAKLLADKINEIEPKFNSRLFIKEVDESVQDLELKDRVELMADLLEEHLSGKYQDQLSVLVKILGPENEKETGMFTEGYWVMPIAKFVEKYGLNDFEASMAAIAEITKRNTGEYTIRPYLKQNFRETHTIMLRWAKSENVHLRRLASEGIRIRLPWATKLETLVEDPSPILQIVDLLKDDSSKFVQKSVANSLNDILKDNYAFGISTIQKWANASDVTPARKWIIKHALRNQLKKSNPEAEAIVANL